jgi:5-hydroxyisourate hydrolase-like protein (transthyretin family)
LENFAQLEGVALTSATPTTRTLNLELRRTGQLELRGSVRAADGSPTYPNGYVRVTSGAFARNFALSGDSSGQYTMAAQTLPSGTYRAQVFSYDYNYYQYQSATLENIVVAAGQTTTSTLDLDFKRLEIEGIVRDSNDQPVAGVDMSFSAYSNDARCLTCSAVTDASGRYRLTLALNPSLTTLNYQLEARKGAYIQVFDASATLTQTTATQDLTLQTAGTRLEIAGRVVNTVGAALEGVRLTFANTSESNCVLCEAITDANGSYRLSVRLPIGATSAAYRLEATLNGATAPFDFADTDLDPAQLNTVTHDLRLNAGAVRVTVRGKALDSSGAALSGVALTLEPPSGSECVTCTAETDSSGNYELSLDTPLGSSAVDVRVVASFLGRQRVLEFNQSIPANQLTVITERDLVMGVQLEITGAVRDASGSALSGVRVFVPDTQNSFCRTCETDTEYGTGQYRLELVLPFDTTSANVRIAVNGYDGDQAFDVIGGLNPDAANGLVQDLEYAPYITAAIRGRVTDRDGLPVPNVSLDVFISSDYEYYGGSLTTDADGQYLLEVRLRRGQSALLGYLIVNLPNARPEFPFSFSIDQSNPNEFTKDITLDLNQTSFKTIVVRGVVTDRLGTVLPGAYVQQYGFGSTFADDQGRYVLTVQALHVAGQLEYSLRGYTAGFEYFEDFVFTESVSGPVPTEVQRDLTLNTARVTLTIRGLVTDATGQPVVGATVGFVDTFEPIVGDASVVTDASGRYELALSGYEGETIGWNLQVTFGTYTSQPVYTGTTLGRSPPYEYTQDLVIQP